MQRTTRTGPTSYVELACSRGRVDSSRCIPYRSPLRHALRKRLVPVPTMRNRRNHPLLRKLLSTLGGQVETGHVARAVRVRPRARRRLRVRASCTRGSPPDDPHLGTTLAHEGRRPRRGLRSVGKIGPAQNSVSSLATRRLVAVSGRTSATRGLQIGGAWLAVAPHDGERPGERPQ